MVVQSSRQFVFMLLFTCEWVESESARSLLNPRLMAKLSYRLMVTFQTSFRAPILQTNKCRHFELTRMLKIRSFWLIK